MWPRLKTRTETICIERNGLRFQCDPDNPFARFGCGGNSSPDIKQGSTLIPSQQDFVTSVLEGMVQPQVGQGFEGYQGERLAEMDPFYTGAAQGGVQNLMGDMSQVFDPIFAESQRMFQDVVSPEVMERFASFGGAGSGGAMQALSRAGADMSTQLGAQLAPLWMQSQQSLPALAQQAGGFEQQSRQQPMDLAQQMWQEQQPYANPYLALGQSMIPGTGQYAENVASPGQEDFLTSMAPGIGMALAMSDERMKENIESIDNALEKLEKLDGKIFDFKHCKGRRGGILAQDLEAVMPEAVIETNGVKYVDYHAVIGLLINAVKALKKGA